MTRLSNDNLTGRSSRAQAPTRATAVHRRGRTWFMVTVARTDSGSKLIDARTAETASELAEALKSQSPDRIVCVLPGGSAVARTLTIPVMEVDDPQILQQAIMLQAEAALPAGVGDYRRAASLLPWSDSRGERLALAVAWPGPAPEPMVADDDLDPAFAPAAAALFEFLSRNGNVGYAGYADRDSGSVELAIRRNDRTVVRTMRLPGGQWSGRVESMIIQSLQNAGVSGDEAREIGKRCGQQAESSPQSLLLDETLRTTVANQLGVPAGDAGWWRDYGLAAGAALGAVSDRHTLFDLKAAPPPLPTAPWLRFALWISNPKVAMRVLIASLLLVVLFPPAASAIRQAILSRKAEGLDLVEQQVREAQEQAAFYRLLQRDRWPMTKLMADISGAAPPGIELDTLRLSPDTTIEIRGSTDTAETLLEFENNLAATAIFRVLPGSSEGNAFENTAIAVIDPYRDAPYAYDYSAEPLRVQLYGEEARERGALAWTTQPLNRADWSSPRSMTVASSPGGDQETQAEESTSRRTTTSIKADPKNPPPPLSDEQIAAMTREELMQATYVRSVLKFSPELDKATKDRMNDEWTRLNNRRKELDQQGGTN